MSVKAIDIAGLRAVAARLVEQTRPGSVIWLTGPLGSGKTTLVMIVVELLGGTDPSSPTFSLLQEYETPKGPVLHADCYRLRDPEEARDLDLWRAASESRMLLVEWPARGGDHVPAPNFRVNLDHAHAEDRRLVEVVAC